MLYFAFLLCFKCLVYVIYPYCSSTY